MDQMPPPSAELILISALVQAHMKSLSKKQRAAFLREVSEALEWQEANATVVRLRPVKDDPAMKLARSRAAEWWRRVRGLFAMRE